MVKPRALNQKMWRDLWALRAQTIATAVLIICGVSLLVSEWSAYRSLQESRDNYYRDYAFADLFAEFKSASVETLFEVAKVPGVQMVLPRLSSEGLVHVSNKTEPAVGRFLSIPSGEQPQLNRLHIRKGRLPVDSSQVEVIVYEGFAEANSIEPEDLLRITVQGKSEWVRVVGIGLSPEYVYALSPSAPLPDDVHFGVFWMTEKSLQRLLKMKDGFNSIVVRLSFGARRELITDEVDRILKSHGSLGAYTRERQISNMFVEDEISQQRVSSIFIPAVFLAIAAFLINIVTSRLITMHRAQIATLKALGYTNWEVSFHYLKLIFVMTIVGTLPGLGLGALLGSWMSSTYESYFRFPDLHFSISLTATLIGLVCGILPGLVGAASAIHSVFNMTPAEAMRPASPALFHAFIFEKGSWSRFLSTSGKMVVRNLLLRPIRLSFIILSISSAIAIVVTAGAWSDMVDYIIQTQFQRLQKEDVSFSLIRPSGLSVLQEVSHLPGVLLAEGFRTVPIRIRYLNHKRELLLMGSAMGTQTRQLSVPRQGVLLSSFFAKSWGIQKGDFIQLEPLEGTNKVFAVAVAGFSDELIGLSANMSLEALWQMLGEDPGYNFITLKVDSHRLSELYVALKERSEVVAINIKNAVYAGFRDTFGKVIRTSTWILMVASLLIATGIIYNSVRVSFSERSWELASLRVLGFERVEVAQILWLEVGVQVLGSLLPGCFLGWGLTHLSLRLIHTETFSFPVVIQASTYARGILVVLLAFLGSSWVVYRMTGRLNPAEALKARE